jgi:predicted HAD superfamily phosphohydrolase YqeG
VDIDNTLLAGPRSHTEPSQQRWLDRGRCHQTTN